MLSSQAFRVLRRYQDKHNELSSIELRQWIKRSIKLTDVPLDERKYLFAIYRFVRSEGLGDGSCRYLSDGDREKVSNEVDFTF
jgi:hypothetical protein